MSDICEELQKFEMHCFQSGQLEVAELVNHARAEIDRLKAELQSQPNQWVPVSERLPDRSDFYIIHPEPKYVDGVCYFNKEIDCHGHEPNTFETESEYGEVVQYRQITHWMPLPEPPNKVKESRK